MDLLLPYWKSNLWRPAVHLMPFLMRANFFPIRAETEPGMIFGLRKFSADSDSGSKAAEKYFPKNWNSDKSSLNVRTKSVYFEPYFIEFDLTWLTSSAKGPQMDLESGKLTTLQMWEGFFPLLIPKESSYFLIQRGADRIFPTTLCRGRDSNLCQESCTVTQDILKDTLPTELQHCSSNVEGF